MICSPSAIASALQPYRPALRVGVTIFSLWAAGCSDSGPVSPAPTATVQIVFHGLVEKRSRWSGCRPRSRVA